MRATGEVDVATTGLLTDALGRAIDAAVATPRSVRVDLSGVTFIDSSGLRSLLVARTRSAAESVTFAVEPASAAVERLISMTGLDDLLRPAG